MAGVTVGVSGYLARHWVKAHGIPFGTIHGAIAMMGLVLALQWFFGFYAGGLYGLQRQVLLNGILVGSTTFRNVGSVFVLWLVSPSIVAFFAWQAVASALQVLATRIALWRSLPPGEGERAHFRAAVVRSALSFALGVSGISIFAVAFTQLDKVLLSRLLSLENFGYYTLAAGAAAGLYYIVGPIFQAAFPHLSSLVAAGASRDAALRHRYHEMCQLVSVLTLPASAVALMFANPLLVAWTGSRRTAAHADVLLALLVVGTALNGLMQVPYALQLAYGWTKLGLVQNGISAVVLIPLLIVVTGRYGAVGAASVWLALNASYVLIGVQVMHRRLLRGDLSRWYLVDVGAPLLVAVATAAVARLVYSAAGASQLVAVAWLAVVFLLASAATVLVTPMTRSRVARRLGLPSALSRA